MQCGLTKVWTETAPSLGRLVRAMSLDYGCGDDILQDVYVLAHQRCPDGLSHEETRRWLFRVTVNRCHLEHRRNARRARAHERLARQTPHTMDGDPATNQLERLESIQLVRQQQQVAGATKPSKPNPKSDLPEDFDVERMLQEREQAARRTAAVRIIEEITASADVESQAREYLNEYHTGAISVRLN